MKPILRVGILNNFNMTDAELEQLPQYEDKYDVFVNANAKTEVRGKYPTILTINPDLTEFVEPRGDMSLVKAVRIKYVSGPIQEVSEAFDKAMAWAHEQNIPILITFMRFKTKKDLLAYTDDQSNYKWRGSYFRQTVFKTWDDPLVNYCDGKEEGCPGCKNCAKLTFGRDTDDLWGVNLSASGECPFNCPSCFAKCITRCYGLTFDKPSQNAKQKGHVTAK
jgi:hypothetical protein